MGEFKEDRLAKDEAHQGRLASEWSGLAST